MSGFRQGWLPFIEQALRRRFATAAQGVLAASAVQPADLAGFASSAQGAKADSALQPGQQFVLLASDVTNTYISGPGHIPFDDTLPLLSEGLGVLAVENFTGPEVQVLIEVSAWMSEVSNTSNYLAAVLFFDSTVLHVEPAYNSAANSPINGGPVKFTIPFTIPDANPHSYSLRIGGDNSSASVCINGHAGSRRYGGGHSSWIRIHRIG